MADTGWADTIPGWLKQKVTLERLLQAYREEEGLATDAEAVCYLYTAALNAPLDHDHTNIYLYISAKVMREAGREMPADLDCPDALSRYEQDCLEQLKRKIWDSGERAYRGRKGAKK